MGRRADHTLRIGMSQESIAYHKKRLRVIEQGKKRKEEVKLEFEEFLKESMDGRVHQE